MKDPTGAIREWLFDALYANVSYGGTIVPVYSFAPKDASMPYILLAGQQMTLDDSTKDSFLTENLATIEVWTSFTGNDASYIEANAIADDIVEILTGEDTVAGSGSQEGGAVLEGFEHVVVMVESILTDSVLWDNNIIIYKSINLKMLVEEE